MIANLPNGAPRPPDELSLIELAEFNIRAAKHAANISAFPSAAEYASKGIESLPAGHWKTHADLSLDLSLDLYSTAMEAEGFLG